MAQAQRFGSEPAWPREMRPRLKLSLTQEYSNTNLIANLATKNQKTLIMMMSTPVCQAHPPETDVVICLIFTHEKIETCLWFQSGGVAKLKSAVNASAMASSMNPSDVPSFPD